MSWEESKPEPHTCPCGKGDYVVIHRSDDWGRFEERWEMRCPHCNANYALYTYYRNHKGITETQYGWVLKSRMQELAELNERLEDKKKELAAYLKTQYGEKWLQHFRGKTKKAIWSALTQDGQIYPSLSTLYAHIRNSGLERVLEAYLNYREAATVIRVLGLKDVKLTSMLEKVRKLEHMVEQKELNVRQQAVA